LHCHPPASGLYKGKNLKKSGESAGCHLNLEQAEKVPIFRNILDRPASGGTATVQ
jgi:hypothetical protein